MSDFSPQPKSKIYGVRKDTVKRNAIKTNETHLQKQCEEWLDWKHITYIRIPDAIYKAIFSSTSRVSPHIKKIISDFIKGLPDLIILDKGNIYNRALCVELKTATGKLSQGQKNFAKRVDVKVIRSFEDFEKEVVDFLRASPASTINFPGGDLS